MNKKNLISAIDDILFNYWDPIGVKDLGGPTDEYHGYIPSIIKLTKSNASVNEIAKTLLHHANVNMGMSTDITDHIKTANKLQQLQNTI